MLIIGGQIFAWLQAGHRGFIWWFFNLDDDRNAPAAFASVMWVIMALIPVAGSLRKSVPWIQKLYWWFVAVVLVLVSVDDFYAIHETMIYDWQKPYMLAGGIFMAINAIAFWFWFRDEVWANKRLVLLAVVAIGIIGLSGFIVESFAYGACEEAPLGFVCQNWWQSIALDEVFELFGTIIFIAAMLLYIQEHSNPTQWQRVKRIVTGGSIIWTAALIAYFWPFPALESRVIAYPVDVEYADEDLALIGYWTPNTVVQPGDRVTVFLYWRSGTGVQRDYRLSAQLLSPDMETIAQDDELHIGQIPSEAWLPGLVVRKAIHFDLPPDIATPASYQLMVRVWRGNPLADWQDVISLPIASTAQTLLTEDTALIGSVAALPKTQTLPDLSPADFQFADGFKLTGYAVPVSAAPGDTLPFQFEWQTQRDIDTPLTQLIHLFNAEDDVFVALDQPPFHGTFPTEDWPANTTLVDEVTVTLPADLAPGTYQIFTGMYNSATLERQPIINAQGQPVANNAIPLATIEISG